MLNLCSSCSFLSPNSKVNDWFCNEIPGAFFLQIFAKRGECELNYEGGVHKLRLQDKVGSWSKNVHFLSMVVPKKMSTKGGRWSKITKILSTKFGNDP